MKKTHIVFLSGAIAVSATGSAVGSSAPQTSGHGSFSAKAYPERNDDFAWENDIVAFRAYGPQTRRNGEKSFGYDIFLKYPGKGLVLEELYAVQTNPANWAKVDSLGKIDPAAAKDFENSFTYHIDHGKGMDCYSVGATLGCGATALLEEGRLVMPWTYETVEVIADTPDSLVFRLDFPPAVAGCDTVTEHRKIRLDKATHLNYSEVYYDGLSSERKIAAGFPLRDNPARFSSSGDGIVAVADPTQGPDNGKALVGLLVPGGVEAVSEIDGHLVAVSTVAPGKPFRYYWGYAWDRTDITSLEDWVEYLRTGNQK